MYGIERRNYGYMVEGIRMSIETEEFLRGVGGSKSSRKAVSGSEVLAEDSEGMGEKGELRASSCTHYQPMTLEALIRLLLRIVVLQWLPQ